MIYQWFVRLQGGSCSCVRASKYHIDENGLLTFSVDGIPHPEDISAVFAAGEWIGFVRGQKIEEPPSNATN